LKPVKILVITIDDEITVLNEAALEAAQIDEAFAAKCYGDKAYWLRLELKDCSFGDQQQAAREAGEDSTLLPQKRFAVGVEKWTKQFCGADSTSILEVSEDAFVKLKPPTIGNAIDAAIFQKWYPGAAKASDFTQAFRTRQKESEEAIKSASTESTPE